MAATVSELFSEAVGLDARDRATLAGLLLESLGPAQRAATNVAARTNDQAGVGRVDVWLTRGDA